MAGDRAASLFVKISIGPFPVGELKAWKSGACKVEDTQLRDFDHIVRWATVLASVALRILRLTYLARHRPQLSAEEELTRDEIDAIGRRSRKRGAGERPPLAR